MGGGLSDRPYCMAISNRHSKEFSGPFLVYQLRNHYKHPDNMYWKQQSFVLNDGLYYRVLLVGRLFLYPDYVLHGEGLITCSAAS